jgi:hypothetical protein
MSTLNEIYLKAQKDDDYKNECVKVNLKSGGNEILGVIYVPGIILLDIDKTYYLANKSNKYKKEDFAYILIEGETVNGFERFFSHYLQNINSVNKFSIHLDLSYEAYIVAHRFKCEDIYVIKDTFNNINDHNVLISLYEKIPEYIWEKLFENFSFKELLKNMDAKSQIETIKIYPDKKFLIDFFMPYNQNSFVMGLCNYCGELENTSDKEIYEYIINRIIDKIFSRTIGHEHIGENKVAFLNKKDYSHDLLFELDSGQFKYENCFLVIWSIFEEIIVVLNNKIYIFKVGYLRINNSYSQKEFAINLNIINKYSIEKKFFKTKEECINISKDKNNDLFIHFSS